MIARNTQPGGTVARMEADLSLLIVGLLAVAGWFALVLVLVAICKAAQRADEASRFVVTLVPVAEEAEEPAPLRGSPGEILSF